MVNRVSKEKIKCCNLCGEDCVVYSVIDNAPVCEDCVPVKDMKKRIPNEMNMINSLLNQKLKK